VLFTRFWILGALASLALLCACQSGTDTTEAPMPSTEEAAPNEAAPSVGSPEAQPAQPPSVKNKGAEQPADTDAEPIDLAKVRTTFDTFVALFEQFGGVVARNGEDCETMGNELEAFAAANGTQFKAAGEVLREVPKGTLETLQGNYGARLTAAQKLLEPLSKCGADAKVQAALKQLM